ncbi:ABC transporter substrate-binding protein [Paenibacillus sp. J31TS4]|uniref:extracellular solute-binding protein n=1 Tax=Paenibacillus sp. J31TS4 TaxID=2807195 RepID=UPI001B0B9B9F|nr:extracellular solute-binding protein [Paenibacillus sp. J31TS4]GIP40426.1 ABC transporter substrate-binding protein [Paenibacillus sp. J31TS4]
MVTGKGKTTLVLLLASASVLSACSGDGAGQTPTAKADEKINRTGMPIVKEPIKVKAFAGRFLADNWNNLMLWKEYEKMTNIQVDWETVQKDVLPEKRNLLLASGDYPDLLYGAAIPRSDILKYGQEGVFLPLNDLIDEYAPNFKKMMDQYPVIRKGITMADGNIYSFPTIYDPEFKSVLTSTMWMKKEWLDKLGLKEPTTTEEFYTVLKAIKEQDPNGNGKPDEIPLGSQGIKGVLNKLSGSFGLFNHGAANGFIDQDPASGKLRFVATDPQYKEMLVYLNRLYKEGLIDKEVFSIKTNEFIARASSGVYGFLNSNNPSAIYSQEGYIGMPVLKGPKGDQKNNLVNPPLGNIGMFLLTKTNKNPEAMVRWMDYFYSDEGTRMFFMGFKDVTYKELPNGDLEYTDEILKNPKGLSLDQTVSQYLVWPGGYYPGFVRQKYFKGAEGRQTSVENAKKAEPYTIKDVWPVFNFTLDEEERLLDVKNDIDTYVDEMRDKFISGAEPIEKWDAYVQTINKMGLDRYMKVYQAAFERYQKEQ